MFLMQQQASHNINSNSILLDLITVGISGIHFVIPSLTVNKILFKLQENTANSTSYDKARLNFTCDYDKSNPMT